MDNSIALLSQSLLSLYYEWVPIIHSYIESGHECMQIEGARKGDPIDEIVLS